MSERSEYEACMQAARDLRAEREERQALRDRVTDLTVELEAHRDREQRLRHLLVRMHPKASAFWQIEIATLLRELDAEKATQRQSTEQETT